MSEQTLVVGSARTRVVVGTVLVLAVVLGAALVPGVAGSMNDGPDASTGVGPSAGGVSPASAPAAGAQQTTDLECSYPLTVTDATGASVTLDEEPERIVSLAPSAAQTLWEFNASGKVVGVNSNAAYLAGADEKEVVMDGTTVRTEVVVGLEPDLVLAPNVIQNGTVETLRGNGLTVYRAGDTKSFEQLYAKTERIGRLAGECEAAAATVADMRERVSAIEAAVSDAEHPGALYTFYGFTTGANTFIDAVMTTAGTTNIAAEVGIDGFTTEPLNPEVVANNSEAIEWLVLNSNPASHPTGDVYNETTAMQANQTVVVNEDYLNQPAPRTVWALENITRAIHPAAYERAQAALEATPTATAGGTASTAGTATPTTAPAVTATDGGEGGMTTESPTATTESTATPTTTGGSGPGFGVGLAVVVLASLGLLRRRR